jgi:DNA repair protein RadD
MRTKRNTLLQQEIKQPRRIKSTMVVPIKQGTVINIGGMTLRPYQKEAVDRTFECIRNDSTQGYCISAPCASGKSLMIAELAKRVINGTELQGCFKRALIVSHVQEIIQQDYDHIEQLLPNQVGVFSAGLKRCDTSHSIIVAGIQSVWRSTRLGNFDMVIVDECHLIPPQETSMYRTLITNLRESNPNLMLVGLTATPFRMDGGNIYGDGKLFNCLSYEIDYKTLMEQGFIVRCKAKEIDIMSDDDFRQLRTRMGEYSQNSIDRVYDSLKIKDIIKDVIDRTKDCKQVLVFSPSVLTCYVIKEHLNSLGGAEIVTGATTKPVRIQLIDDFKQFKFKYLINVNCLNKSGKFAAFVELLVLTKILKCR